MKKFVTFILLLLISTSSVHALSSETAIVMEASTNRVLFEKEINKEKLIASTTKIMTAILALESGKMDEVVKIDDTVLKSYGSGIYISVGEEMTLRDLVYGLMLRSGNDAAIMISTYLAGSEEEFAKLMNEKASRIGMTNTVFNNSSGLDESTENISTAYDMALLMSYATKNSEFMEISGCEKHIVKTNMKTYVWHNKNKLLYNYEYATGGKTGYTEKALRTLVTSAKKDDMDLVIVTLNDPNDFSNHENLYEEMFNKYSMYEILNKDKFEVENNDYYRDRLYIENNFSYPATEAESALFIIDIKLEKIKNYKDNDKVGELVIKLDKTIIHTEDIYIDKEDVVKKKSFFEKLFSGELW